MRGLSLRTKVFLLFAGAALLTVVPALVLISQAVEARVYERATGDLRSASEALRSYWSVQDEALQEVARRLAGEQRMAGYLQRGDTAALRRLLTSEVAEGRVVLAADTSGNPLVGPALDSTTLRAGGSVVIVPGRGEAPIRIAVWPVFAEVDPAAADPRGEDSTAAPAGDALALFGDSLVLGAPDSVRVGIVGVGIRLDARMIGSLKDVTGGAEVALAVGDAVVATTLPDSLARIVEEMDLAMVVERGGIWRRQVEKLIHLYSVNVLPAARRPDGGAPLPAGRAGAAARPGDPAVAAWGSGSLALALALGLALIVARIVARPAQALAAAASDLARGNFHAPAAPRLRRRDRAAHPRLRRDALGDRGARGAPALRPGGAHPPREARRHGAAGGAALARDQQPDLQHPELPGGARPAGRPAATRTASSWSWRARSWTAWRRSPASCWTRAARSPTPRRRWTSTSWRSGWSPSPGRTWSAHGDPDRAASSMPDLPAGGGASRRAPAGARQPGGQRRGRDARRAGRSASPPARRRTRWRWWWRTPGTGIAEEHLPAHLRRLLHHQARRCAASAWASSSPRGSSAATAAGSRWRAALGEGSRFVVQLPRETLDPALSRGRSPRIELHGARCRSRAMPPTTDPRPPASSSSTTTAPSASAPARCSPTRATRWTPPPAATRGWSGCAAERYHLVLLDLKMEGRSGLSVLEEIRRAGEQRARCSCSPATPPWTRRCRPSSSARTTTSPSRATTTCCARRSAPSSPRRAPVLARRGGADRGEQPARCARC